MLKGGYVWCGKGLKVVYVFVIGELCIEGRGKGAGLISREDWWTIIVKDSVSKVGWMMGVCWVEY